MSVDLQANHRTPIFFLAGREPFLAMLLEDFGLLGQPTLGLPDEPLSVLCEQLSLLTLMEQLAAEARADDAIPLLLVRQDSTDDLLLAFDRQDWPSIAERQALIRLFAVRTQQTGKAIGQILPGGERGVGELFLI